MKKKYWIFSVAILAFFACNEPKKGNTEAVSDTATANEVHIENRGKIFARMQTDKVIKGTDSVMLTFSVYNPADSVQEFCKWHTPFEPLISKYLDIKNEKGEEVAYKGAMAKRMMPAPADSYVKVNPKETLSTKVDLLLGYDLKTGNKYTIVYAGENMSGLSVRDTVSFVYEK